ncbi:MAG: glycosyltransferase family 4 protein [candidate division Zixibacteria bacterium]|nr:glycosyltransferase family 4 protein [candidate division Zixibacteria bacterium]
MRIMYIGMANSAHTRRWVENIRDRGNEIMLVSFYNSPDITGIDLRYIPCRNKNLAVLKTNQVKKLIGKFKPDILHAHYATSCGLVGALTGFHPYVLSTWGDDIFEFPKKSPIHRWVVRKAILSADYLTATSNMLERETNRLVNNSRKIEVIPFGVDLEHFGYHDRSDCTDVHIGTVRNLRPKYGLQFLIEAFSILRKSYKNIKLSIVGDGFLRPELEVQVIKLGMADDVTFHGPVPNEQVVNYMKKFDIFAIPSVGQGETFGVAAVEAMATGLPVVASNIGGLPEVVDNGTTGLLVNPGSAEDLAGALESYITSSDTRLEHGLKGRERVEKLYDWQENTDKMNRLYEKILDENK